MFLKYRNACFPADVKSIKNIQLVFWKRNISGFGYAGRNNDIETFLYYAFFNKSSLLSSSDMGLSLITMDIGSPRPGL